MNVVPDGVQLLPADGHRAVAWKNGGGRTFEVAAFPPDADVAGFDWRISIAEIDSPGPFSSFPGIDRVLVPLGAGGVTLVVDGVAHLLPVFVPFAFDGESDVTSVLTGGPCADLNVMTRRGAVTATVEVVELTDDVEVAGGDGTVVLVVLDGAGVVGGHDVGVRDAVVAGRGAEVECASRSATALTLAVVRLIPLPIMQYGW